MDINAKIGIIYEINGGGLSYIGSTIQPLYERKASHKSQYKLWVKNGKTGWICASYRILDICSDWTITILEKIITDEKKQVYWNEKIFGLITNQP